MEQTNQIVPETPVLPPAVTPELPKSNDCPAWKQEMKDFYKPFAQPGIIYTTGIAFTWILLLLGFWSQAPTLIPGPMAVGKSLVTFLTDSEFYEDIITSLSLTSKAMLISIVISCIAAYLSVSPIFRPVATFLVKLRFMSLIGLVFTFTLILKAGGEVKTALLMFGIIPFFTLSLLSVITRIDQREYDLWTTLRYSRWEQVYQIIIRGKADYTIEAIRANFAMAWLMITMVESFSMSEGGIGVLLYRFNKFNQLDNIFALQIIVFCLGMGFDYGLKKLRYLAFPHTALAEKQ